MGIKSVGIDCVEVKRFRELRGKAGKRFSANMFTAREFAYCRAYKDAAVHFAGLFALKEAVLKSLGKDAVLPDIEIRHERTGAPSVFVHGKKTSLKVSITHTRTFACAIAVR